MKDSPRTRRRLCYSLVPMAAWIPLMVVVCAVVDWATGRSAWFEFGYGYTGEGPNHCKRVGDKVSCVFVDSKSVLEISNFMVGIVVWFAV